MTSCLQTARGQAEAGILTGLARSVRNLSAASGLTLAGLVMGCTAPSEPAAPPPTVTTDTTAGVPGGNAPSVPPPVVTASTIVGRWDLRTLDHRSLPVEVYHSPTGQSVYAVEGHLILQSDGTYRRWTVTQGAGFRDSVIGVGSYVFAAAPTPTLTLRIDASNEGVGVFAGATLSITYTDFLDWWDETFVRSP